MKKIMAVFGLVLAAGIVAYTTACPCGRVPGAWLMGSTESQPVEDWSFVNDRAAIPLCQLQITTWRPHSINLNCMSNNGELFVSCSNCASKQWSKDALTHPHARLRAGPSIYPVTLTRLTDAARLDIAWAARIAKTGSKGAQRPDHWWSFQLESSKNEG